MSTKFVRVSCFKPTSDPWHSEYRIANDKRHENEGFVHVSLIEMIDHTWRTCVWGNDDNGVEFDTPDANRARDLYIQICMMPVVTRAALEDLGFVRA